MGPRWWPRCLQETPSNRNYVGKKGQHMSRRKDANAVERALESSDQAGFVPTSVWPGAHLPDWILPSRAQLLDGVLVFDDGFGEVREATTWISDKALKRFVALDSDDDLLRFATDFGPLYEPGGLMMVADWDVGGPHLDERHREPVTAWRLWRDLYAAVLNTIVLSRGQRAPIPPDGLREAIDRWSNQTLDRSTTVTIEPPFTQRRWSEVLCGLLNEIATVVHIELVVREVQPGAFDQPGSNPVALKAERYTPDFRSALFVLLVGIASGTSGGVGFCTGCSALVLRTRVARIDGDVWCDECITDGTRDRTYKRRKSAPDNR